MTVDTSQITSPKDYMAKVDELILAATESDFDNILLDELHKGSKNLLISALEDECGVLDQKVRSEIVKVKGKHQSMKRPITIFEKRLNNSKVFKTRLENIGKKKKACERNVDIEKIKMYSGSYQKAFEKEAKAQITANEKVLHADVDAKRKIFNEKTQELTKNVQRYITALLTKAKAAIAGLKRKSWMATINTELDSLKSGESSLLNFTNPGNDLKQ